MEEVGAVWTIGEVGAVWIVEEVGAVWMVEEVGAVWMMGCCSGIQLKPCPFCLISSSVPERKWRIEISYGTVHLLSYANH